MDHSLSRRSVLGSAAGLSAGLLTLGLPADARAPQRHPARPTRALRVVHMTDMHIQPERAADQGVAACFRHIHAMKDKPDLILTGGDTIMDSFDEGFDRTKALWDLWTRTAKDENPIPMLSAVGNHDIWGWNKSKSKTKGDEKGWGKAWVCDIFARDKPYASLDQGGWHMIALDSTQPDRNDPNGYEAFLDEAQFDWLSRDLAANKDKPTLILSHIPILSATVFDGIKPNAKGNLEVSGGLMHTDFAKLNDLFLKNTQVKACVSGHMHLVDKVTFNGVTHYCNGAVSGGWWKGDHKTCKPGYAVMDLMTDGSVTREYVTYGWDARP
jgi:3',5'-cyclic-AMP phosphodiesterase